MVKIFRIASIYICLTLLACLSVKTVPAEEYIKNIEIGEADIKLDQSELPSVAYLYVELKNNGDKKISNVTFEINYLDTEGYPLEKATVKYALIDALPKGETHKYKVRLSGDAINTEHEQYPYSQLDKVGSFDIKISSVKLASK